MTTDDYILYKSLQDRGLFPTQVYMFGWTGRYTAIFVESLLLEAGLPHLYFLHTWLLLAATWAALYFVLGTVNTRLLNGVYGRRLLLLGSAFLLLLFFYIQAEIATSLYWFSAAIPYQLAFILFLLLAGCLIRRFYDSSRSLSNSRWYDLTIVLLIFLIAGCNEIAATFLILLLLALLGGARRLNRSVNRSLIAYLLTAIALGLSIVYFSGLFHLRYKIMRSSAGYTTVFPIILFRAFEIFYFILKLPLFWIAALTLYIAGSAHPLPPNFALSATTRKLLINGLVIVLGLTLLTLSAVTLVTRGPLPQRALNNLIDLTALGLLALIFIAGAVFKPKINLPILPILLICTIVAANPFVDAWSSCFSGYFYAAAEETREQQIRVAATSHEKTVELPPFQQSLEQEVRQEFPHGTFATVGDWLQTRPPFLYFAQHSEEACRAYAVYCGLDSVNIQNSR
jgi:hypothetical protein